MVDMTRAWRMLDYEISRTPMPEEYNNFYVKVDYVTILLFVCLFVCFFVMGCCHGSFEAFKSSLVIISQCFVDICSLLFCPF